jgi:hypothetical protein
MGQRLGRITGTVYRGTERISSNTLLNLLEVGPDLVTRQKWRNVPVATLNATSESVWKCWRFRRTRANRFDAALQPARSRTIDDG